MTVCVRSARRSRHMQPARSVTGIANPRRFEPARMDARSHMRRVQPARSASRATRTSLPCLNRCSRPTVYNHSHSYNRTQAARADAQPIEVLRFDAASMQTAGPS
eukprot:366015-Chlamydomonas_euryale.AAC.1